MARNHLSPRRRARQYAVQALYQLQINPDAGVGATAAAIRADIEKDAANRLNELNSAPDAFAAQTPAPSEEQLDNYRARIARKIDKAIAEKAETAAFFAQLFPAAYTEREGCLKQLSAFLDRREEELSPVEKAVLVLAYYELSHMPETPRAVVINEAIELAKTYGSNDGYRFVNGILDRAAQALGEPNPLAPA